MKTKIPALSAERAIDRLKEKIIVHKIEEVPDTNPIDKLRKMREDYFKDSPLSDIFKP